MLKSHHKNLLALCFLFAVEGVNADVKTSLTWAKADKAAISKLATLAVKSDDMYEIVNSNWTVRTYYGRVFAAEASLFMEEFSGQIIMALLEKPVFKVKEKPILTIFDTASKYYENSDAPENSRGLCAYRYKSTPQGNSEWEINLYTYFEKNAGKEPEYSECHLPIILHEGTHAVIAKMFGEIVLPIWLNEGIACYYESMQIKGGNKLSGAKTAILDVRARQERTSRSFRPEIIKDYLIKWPGAKVSLEYLASLSSEERWNPDSMGEKTGFNYALAESFIDFLMSSQEGRMVLRKIISQVSSGTDYAVIAASIKTLDPKWKAYLANIWKVRIK